MKRMINVLAWTLALNFLFVVAAVAWLWKDQRLDRQKLHAIHALLFPPAAPTTRPAAAPATQPSKLDEMLTQYAALPAEEQLRLIRQSFDTQLAELDRGQRNLADLQRTVKLAQDRLAADRIAFESQKQQLVDKEKHAELLAADKGFQDTLNLYTTMPAKQVKSIFMGMNDDTAVRYLQAMEPRAAAKITREFKTGDEVDRLKRMMERMRQPTPEASASAQGSSKE